MNWEAVIAITETIGLAAVVASLVYVAIQVRQNSKLIDQNTLATRSAMVHDTTVSYNRFFELIAENGELADIYRRGTDGAELEPTEITRFEALVEMYMASLEDADHQYKSDLYFDEEDDTDLVEFMAAAYRPLLGSKYGRDWWDRTAKDTCTPSFYAKITKILDSWDAEKG